MEALWKNARKHSMYQQSLVKIKVCPPRRYQQSLAKIKVCPPQVGATAGSDVVHRRSHILSTAVSTAVRKCFTLYDQIQDWWALYGVKPMEIIIESVCHVIHVEEGQSAQNHSFVVDLVATQKHRQSPSKIKVNPTQREPVHFVQEGKCISVVCRGGAEWAS